MSSIYNKTDNEIIISRINTLSPESKAQWGKMSVAQMLSHCQAPMDVAFGNLSLKANPIIALLGRLMKNKIINSPEFKKNSPTAPAFIRNEPCDFENSKSELIQKISRLADEGKEVIKVHKHPFFGKMNDEEWDQLMWKHMDHHLRQFGV
jgi:hypothetical protein